MKVTNESLIQFLEMKEAVEKRVVEVLDEMCQIEHGKEHWGDITDIEYGKNYITISTEEYSCGCCGPDYHTYSVPKEYLYDYDGDWKERLKKEIEDKKIAEEKRKALEKQKREEEREQFERQQYEKLKMKYESKNE